MTGPLLSESALRRVSARPALQSCSFACPQVHNFDVPCQTEDLEDIAGQPRQVPLWWRAQGGRGIRGVRVTVFMHRLPSLPVALRPRTQRRGFAASAPHFPREPFTHCHPVGVACIAVRGCATCASALRQRRPTDQDLQAQPAVPLAHADLGGSGGRAAGGPRGLADRLREPMGLCQRQAGSAPGDMRHSGQLEPPACDSPGSSARATIRAGCMTRCPSVPRGSFD
jgi:hypothetical protein